MWIQFSNGISSILWSTRIKCIFRRASQIWAWLALPWFVTAIADKNETRTHAGKSQWLSTQPHCQYRIVSLVNLVLFAPAGIDTACILPLDHRCNIARGWINPVCLDDLFMTSSPSHFRTKKVTGSSILQRAVAQRQSAGLVNQRSVVQTRAEAFFLCGHLNLQKHIAEPFGIWSVIAV